MPRPNLAQDAPPTEIMVGGVSYSIDVDFRVWIDVLLRLRELVTTPKTIQDVQKNADIIAQTETAVFGKIIPHPAPEVLEAVSAFAEGYPEASVEGSGRDVETYSFDWDINYIILAIMNQFGIDLTYRRKEAFHWWEFLVYFHALCGDHYILRLMEIRGYDGKDSEMKRQAQRYALPRSVSGDEQAMLNQFDEIFYNA